MTVRWCALLAAFCALPALGAPAASPSGELSELRDRIKSLQQEMESAQGAKSDASDALKHSEQAISAANRELHKLAQQQREANGEVARLQQDSGKTRSSIAGQQEQIGKLLTQLYLHGQHDYLEILFSQQDPNQLARHMRYYADISHARAELIRSLHGNLQHLDKLTVAEKKKAAELARIEVEQALQSKQLKKEQSARKSLLATLSKKIAAQRHEIGKLKNDEKSLTSLIERLSRQAAAKAAKKVKPMPPRKSAEAVLNTALPAPEDSNSPFRQLKGKLHLPIKGELANSFGSPREDGGLTWKGLFIRSAAGQAVKAVAGGQVVFSDWLRGFGNIIIIDHGDSFMSLYGNNETLYKQAGENVKAGDTVASVGNSGGIPESGLYFELRYQSKPFNPLTWVSLK